MVIANITTGDDFAGLRDYLVENRDADVMDLRGVSSLDHAPDEMEAVAGLSSRVRKPVLHLSFSASIEDRRLNDGMWLTLVEEVEEELGLVGHQRIVVRHRDKPYDHIHAVWCTISDRTGQIPPRQWYRKVGASAGDIGSLALRGPDLDRVPDGERVLKPYNSYALTRLQVLCRGFERKLDLRQLRTPNQAAAARRVGELRPAPPSDRKRSERLGSTPVSARGDVVRAALDASDWRSARHRLNAAGLDLKPAVRRTKTGGERVLGLVIFDMLDPGNRAKASQFDLPGRKYGLAHLEERHVRDALSLERWWSVRGRPIPPDLDTATSAASTKQSVYRQAREAHQRAEQEKAERRRVLRKRQAIDRKRVRAELMALRRLRAERLTPSQRRAFYCKFSRTTRARIWSKMTKRHAREAIGLAKRPFPTFSKFTIPAPTPPDAYAEPCVTTVQVRDSKPRVERSDRAIPSIEWTAEQVPIDEHDLFTFWKNGSSVSR